MKSSLLTSGRHQRLAERIQWLIPSLGASENIGDVFDSIPINHLVSEYQDMAIDVLTMFRELDNSVVCQFNRKSDRIVIVEYDRNDKVESVIVEIADGAQLDCPSFRLPTFDLVSNSVIAEGVARRLRIVLPCQLQTLADEPFRVVTDWVISCSDNVPPDQFIDYRSVCLQQLDFRHCSQLIQSHFICLHTWNCELGGVANAQREV